jgi:hypothetical protein
MATALHSYTVAADGQIHARHTFFGKNDAEAEDHWEAFMAAIPGDDETIEIYEDVTEIPNAEMLRDLAEPDEDDDAEEDEDDEDEEDEEEIEA